MRRMHGISAAAVAFLILFLGGCDLSQAPTPTPSSLPPAATSQVSQATSPAAPATSPAAPATSAPATSAPQATAPVVQAPTAAPVGPETTASLAACALTPIDLSPKPKGYGGDTFNNPDVISSENGVLKATLDVRYAKHTIAGCPVQLRSYNGKLVGDTWRVKPGDTLEITLTNNLVDQLVISSTLTITSNAVYNVTNLHTHGLHTSPTGSPDAWGDNVLLEVLPNEQTQPAAHGEGMTVLHGVARYKIKIPKDHPAGTFWYHAHAHGSTAAQVSSGMGGALIVEGGENSLDGVLNTKLYSNTNFLATEKIFMLQQNVYDVNGVIEAQGYGDFGPCTWEPTYREHTINGQLYPTITIAPGEVQRWRFVHAGVRETISLQLRGPGPDGVTTVTPTLAISPTQSPALNEIAVDGIALGDNNAPGRVDSWHNVDLNPGYRSDVLVKIDTPGTYYLIDGPSSAEALTCPTQHEQPSLLAKVEVKGDPNTMKLATSADLAAAKVAPFADLVKMDTTQPITSEKFLVPTVPITAFQETDFTVVVHPTSAITPVLGFLAGDRSFSADHVRTVTLGNNDVWILETKNESLYYAHPFHIHINPFQTSRFGPDGKTPQLVWRDTLLVPKGQTQYIYTNYKVDTEKDSGFKDFTTTGKFVYHCHILDHEDQGMMEIVEIAEASP